MVSPLIKGDHNSLTALMRIGDGLAIDDTAILSEGDLSTKEEEVPDLSR